VHNATYISDILDWRLRCFPLLQDNELEGGEVNKLCTTWASGIAWAERLTCGVRAAQASRAGVHM
jgi:hypothetical protein